MVDEFFLWSNLGKESIFTRWIVSLAQLWSRSRAVISLMDYLVLFGRRVNIRLMDCFFGLILEESHYFLNGLFLLSGFLR